MRKLTAVSIGLAAATFGFGAMAQDAPASASTSSSSSGIPISLGLRIGYAIPLGSSVKDVSMSDSGVKGAIPFQLDALYRVNSNIRVGLYFSYAIVMLDKDKLLGAVPASARDQLDVSGSWLKYGLQIQYHISPEASMDPWLGYGIGLESLKYSVSGGGLSASGGLSGIEFAHLAAGAAFKVTPSLGIGPVVDFSLGQYSSTTGDSSGDINDKAMHEWLTIGVAGNFDL